MPYFRHIDRVQAKQFTPSLAWEKPWHLWLICIRWLCMEAFAVYVPAFPHYLCPQQVAFDGLLVELFILKCSKLFRSILLAKRPGTCSQMYPYARTGPHRTPLPRSPAADNGLLANFTLNSEAVPQIVSWLSGFGGTNIHIIPYRTWPSDIL